MTVEGKTVLVVEVFLSGLRPHYRKMEGPENGVYVRLGSTNRQADRELIAELRRSAEGIAFDELSMPDLSCDDLDLASMKSLLKGKRALGEEELITLKLLTHEQGRLVPTKAPYCCSERIESVISPMPGSSADGLEIPEAIVFPRRSLGTRGNTILKILLILSKSL